MHEILLVNPREMGLCLRQPGVQDSGEFELNEFEISEYKCMRYYW